MESPFFVKELFSNRNERMVKLVIGNNNPDDYIISGFYRISDGWDIISVDPGYNVMTMEISFVLTYREDKDPDIFDLMFHLNVMKSDKYVLEIHCTDDSINTWIRPEIQKNSGE